MPDRLMNDEAQDDLLVSVRNHIESLESFVIQGVRPDSRERTHVDEGKSRLL